VLDIGRIRTLRGPNIWTQLPVIEFTLSLDLPAEPSPRPWHRLRDAVRAVLADHRCAWLCDSPENPEPVGRPGYGIDLAGTLARLTLGLQALAGCRVAFWSARPAAVADHTAQPAALCYRIACEYDEPAVALACLDSARALLVAALRDEPYDAASDIARLRALCQELHLGPSTGAIAQAARARGIPVQRLGTANLLVLGQGVRQRRVWTAETDRTGAIAEAIAQDKDLTRLLLRSVGVPVPDGRPVANPEEAWATAQALGLPVVIKPRFGNHGRGISANLHTREQVERAFAAALAEAPEVLCERHIPGADHRLLVVGERVVAAALREPAQVIGDGVATVRELIDRVNADPRRSDGHATVLSRIKLDAIGLAVLAEQGYTADSVPTAGARVMLRRTANLSTGGTASDITDRVHPEAAARAVDAARVVGLDIAGVDLLAQDIGASLESQGGAVVEVNAGPGLRMHLEPSAGTPRPVGEAIVELLFPPGQDGRIPVIAVSGALGTAVAGRIARLLSHRRTGVVLSAADGRFLDGRRLGDALGSAGTDADACFLNPRAEVAVIEVRPEAIARGGLDFDRCRVCVLMPSATPGPDAGDPVCAEDLTSATHCLLQSLAPDGIAILDAEDTHAAALADACPGSIVWLARDPEPPRVRGHRARGGRAVIERDGELLLAVGPEEESVARLTSMPSIGRTWLETGAGDLAAAAVAWVLGVPVAEIGARLEESHHGC